MKKNTLKFKFKKIKNFLNKVEVDICREYMLIQLKNNFNNFVTSQNSNLDTIVYSYALIESLLLNKKKCNRKRN